MLFLPAVHLFHVTSMTVMQYVSEENLGDEILCNTDIEFTFNTTGITLKKVPQIPESYKCGIMKCLENTIVSFAFQNKLQ